MRTLHEVIKGAQQPSARTPDVGPLVDMLKERFGSSLSAVLLYGSCKDTPNIANGLIDLAVIVESYRVHASPLTRILNACIPPNVYFIHKDDLQSKYAVVSLAQFQHRMQATMDHYFWARFSQPFTVVYAVNDSVRESLIQAQVNALTQFYSEIIPFGFDPKTPIELWAQGLSLTYGCELRPERPSHSQQLIERYDNYWTEVTELLSAQLPHLQHASLSQRLRWRIRPVYGKLMNLARLLKAAGTFANGIDYIAWKIERHSGVKFTPAPWMRRFPRIAGFRLAYTLWRQGGFK